MDTAKAKAEAVTGDVEKSAGDIKEKITKTFTDEAEELKAKLSGTGTAAPAQEKASLVRGLVCEHTVKDSPVFWFSLETWKALA